MTKTLAFVFGLVLLVALGYGGWALFDRYGNASRQIERMVGAMSRVETVRIKVALRRAPRSEPPFLFGDLRAQGSLDARVPSQVVYDLGFDLGTGDERANVLVRQTRGGTFVEIADAPTALADLLNLGGVSLGSWNRVEGTAKALELLGEEMPWPVFAPEGIASTRTLIASLRWFLDSKATLTEIVHGRVTRIFTATLDPESLAAFERDWMRLAKGRELTPDETARIESHSTRWKGARVNLWIDQRTDELRRAVVQSLSGDSLDVEFEEIGGNVVIEEPREETLPLAEESENSGMSPEASGNSEAGDVNLSEGGLFPTPGDTDGDGLTDDLEGFYGSDPRNPDTDGDGYLDSEEVKNGYSPTGNGTLFNFGLPTL